MQPKSEQEKANAKAGRALEKERAETEERRAVEELRIRRAQQLQSAQSAMVKLEEDLCSVRAKVRSSEALSSHLCGFYEEIDKLAKGKNLLEVTNLVVEQANYIIRDAKTLIEGDPHLDRVKEFVPAGNNPLYPDVLLTARTVQQSLERFQTCLRLQTQGKVKLLHESKTLCAALQCCLATDDDSVSKEDVERSLDLGENVVDAWFLGDELGGEYFDFDRLDRTDLEANLFKGEESRNSGSR